MVSIFTTGSCSQMGRGAVGMGWDGIQVEAVSESYRVNQRVNVPLL